MKAILEELQQAKEELRVQNEELSASNEQLLETQRQLEASRQTTKDKAMAELNMQLQTFMQKTGMNIRQTSK